MIGKPHEANCKLQIKTYSAHYIHCENIFVVLVTNENFLCWPHAPWFLKFSFVRTYVYPPQAIYNYSHEIKP